jgi:hypothetical protein
MEKVDVIKACQLVNIKRRGSLRGERRRKSSGDTMTSVRKSNPLSKYIDVFLDEKIFSQGINKVNVNVNSTLLAARRYGTCLIGS